MHDSDMLVDVHLDKTTIYGFRFGLQVDDGQARTVALCLFKYDICKLVERLRFIRCDDVGSTHAVDPMFRQCDEIGIFCQG